MDIIRKDAGRRKWIRRLTVVGVLAVVIPAITVSLAKLKPAAPVVESGSVWPDTVKRGQMICQVRGIGTLVAEDILWIPATTDGRVEKILMRPGAVVSPDTVILTLTNPELEVSSLDQEFQVKAAEARLLDLKVQLDSQTLTQQAELAQIESAYTQSKLRLDRDEAMYKEQLIVELTVKLSRDTVAQLERRMQIERERLKIKRDSVDAQLAVQRADIDKLKALSALKKTHLAQLTVRAGSAGVLQELPVQVGQRVPAGTILAKVAQPTRLKAELKVPETQIKEVQIGQYAEIDTRNGVIKGRVSRIEPAAKEGTVLVEVRLEGALPPGARPDLSVDGMVEYARLRDVVHMARPAFGQQDSTVSMFKVDRDGKGASRVQVKLGRTSVNTVEIREGLAVGDRVILSDMSAWDAYDRIALR
jgi:HlyD family secretion protein